MISNLIFQLVLVAGISSPVMAAPIFFDDFGNSSARVSSPYVPQVPINGILPYKYSVAGGIPDDYYAVLPTHNLSTTTGSAFWGTIPDHTTGTTGAALVVNAGNILNQFYRRSFLAIPGTYYKIKAYRLTRNSVAGSPPTNFSRIKFEAQDVALGTMLGQSLPITNTLRDTWEEMSWTFYIDPTCESPTPIAISLVNNYSFTDGNDFFIDDISLDLASAPGDLVDCPTTKASTLPIVTTNDDFREVLINQSRVIDLTANDSVSNSGVFNYTSLTFTQPSHGVVTKSGPGGGILYTPIAGYAGPDSFRYTICESTSPTPSCSTSVVTLSIVAAYTVAPIPTLGAVALFWLSLLLMAVVAYKSRSRFPLNK